MTYETVKSAIYIALGVGAILGWGVKVTWVDPLMSDHATDIAAIKATMERDSVDLETRLLFFCHINTTRVNKLEKKTDGEVQDTKICDYLRKRK